MNYKHKWKPLKKGIVTKEMQVELRRKYDGRKINEACSRR